MLEYFLIYLINTCLELPKTNFEFWIFYGIFEGWISTCAVIAGTPTSITCPQFQPDFLNQEQNQWWEPFPKSNPRKNLKIKTKCSTSCRFCCFRLLHPKSINHRHMLNVSDIYVVKAWKAITRINEKLLAQLQSFRPSRAFRNFSAQMWNYYR
jgi:hypothetical protein